MTNLSCTVFISTLLFKLAKSGFASKLDVSPPTAPFKFTFVA